MSLLRNVIKSNVSLRTINPNQDLPFLRRQSPKCFSTETEPPSSADDSSIDPFLQEPNDGFVYGKLIGATKHTLKTDIINMLEGCNLAPDDVKVNYTRNFMPVGMMLQFRSRYAFNNAFKVITRKGRLYRLDRVDRAEWDMVMPYNGKTVLLQGIPQNALADDVERFLSGCDFDASSLQIFTRAGPPGNPSVIRMATVRFPAQTQAMNAFLRTNRGFCLNNQILVQVLH